VTCAGFSVQGSTSEDSASQAASVMSEVSDEAAPILGRRAERERGSHRGSDTSATASRLTDSHSEHTDDSDSDWELQRVCVAVTVILLWMFYSFPLFISLPPSSFSSSPVLKNRQQLHSSKFLTSYHLWWSSHLVLWNPCRPPLWSSGQRGALRTWNRRASQPLHRKVRYATKYIK
jgi:hypothetical protein